MYGMSGADLFALRWLDAVIAVPVWLLAAGSVFLVAALFLLLLRSRMRWVAAPVALLALAISGGVWLQDFYPRSDGGEALASRLANWRSQAVAAQPILACLDTEVDPTVDAACERALFSRPEHLAAATAYVAQSINLLADAQQHPGVREAVFERDLERLRTLLERDRFGLVANLLVMEEGCTSLNCDALALFGNPVAVQDNIGKRTFQTHVAQHLDPSNPRPVAVAARPTETAPGGAGLPIVAAPLPSDYVLPSASTIPPISIMNDEGSGAPPAATRSTPPASGQRPPSTRRASANTTGELKPLSLSQ